MDPSLPETATSGTPRDADAVRPVLIGTALWAAALVVLLGLGDRLPVADPDRWAVVAATGTALGLLGIVITRTRARRSNTLER